MGPPSHGFPTMGPGICVPSGDPELDRILFAIQAHADCRPADEGPEGLRGLTDAYERRDQELYEAIDRARPRAAKRSPAASYCDLMLEAVEEHASSEPKGRTLEEVTRRGRKRDAILYDQTAAIRVEAVAFSDTAGIYLGEDLLERVLDGRKDVMRMPVELNRHGKYLPSYYERSNLNGVSYLLCGPPIDSTEHIRVIEGHRLEVISVAVEELGEVTDEEARREGLGGRTEFLTNWCQLHGSFPFGWPVWRYEIALIDG